MASYFCSDKLSLERISSIQFFLGFNRQDLEALSDIIKVHRFNKGSCIINEGDDAQKVYFIIEGSAKVYKKNPSGKDEEVGNLQVEQYFGEMAFVDRGKRSATVIAETDLMVAELVWNDFCSTFLKKPEIIVQAFKNIALTLSLRLRRSNAMYSYLEPSLKKG